MLSHQIEGGFMNAEQITNRVQDWQKRIGDSAQKVGQVTDRYIHEHAWTTLAFAAIVGCVIGFLLGNRRD
jgi:ElaB/YqjD/DUF883 family membrane-anchored ribosome-binding protein